MQLSIKAYAKINWSLNILARQEDGYHQMDMLMQDIDLYDEMSFAPASMLTLTVNGRMAPGGERNLVIRAARTLSEYAGVRGGAKIHLTKRIPIRAGLGGGSADCAAALVALNKLWRLNLSADVLLRLGATLGADVPFCMTGGIARVRGIGERIDSLATPPEVSLVLLHPGCGLSTAEVFTAYDAMDDAPKKADMQGVYRALCEGRYQDLRALCHNALEGPAQSMLPEIHTAKEALQDNGAMFAQMTGSGSAVFGVFSTHEDALRAKQALGDAAILTKTRV